MPSYNYVWENPEAQAKRRVAHIAFCFPKTSESSKPTGPQPDAELAREVIEAARKLCEHQNTTALCDLARALAAYDRASLEDV